MLSFCNELDKTAFCVCVWEGPHPTDFTQAVENEGIQYKVLDRDSLFFMGKENYRLRLK